MGRSSQIRHQRRRRAERSGALAERLALKRQTTEQRKLQAAISFDTGREKRTRELEVFKARVAKMPPLTRYRKPIPSSI